MDKLDTIKKGKYLKLLKKGIGRCEALATVGIKSRQTLATYRKKYPKFAEQESMAEAECDGKIESALHAAAKGGNVIAMIFWLKNRQPEDWRDTKSVTVQGSIKIEDIEISLKKIACE